MPKSLGTVLDTAAAWMAACIENAPGPRQGDAASPKPKPIGSTKSSSLAAAEGARCPTNAAIAEMLGGNGKVVSRLAPSPRGSCPNSRAKGGSRFGSTATISVICDGDHAGKSNPYRRRRAQG